MARARKIVRLMLFAGMLLGLRLPFVLAEAELETVRLTYLYTGDEAPRNLAEIEARANEYLADRLPLRVELVPVSLDREADGVYNLMLARGERVDLLCLAYIRTDSYIREGRLRPLNDLVEAYGPDIQAYSRKYPIFDGCAKNGVLYGISPVELAYGYQSNLLLKQPYWDELGLEMKERFSWDEITDILLAIKSRHPDCAPLALLGTDMEEDTSLTQHFLPYDCLGATVASGVLMAPGDTRIVDLFETEAYRDFLARVRAWYQLGLIRPDAAFCSADKRELFAKNYCVADVLPSKLESYPDIEAIMGSPVVSLATSEGCYLSARDNAHVYWAINAASEVPEAAMRLLNLIYADTDLMNLLRFGQTQCGDAAPETNSAFDCGDMTLRLDVANRSGNDALQAWSRRNLANRYVSYGYRFDPDGVYDELHRIGEILRRYLPVLETGCLEDWEAVHARMLEELKAAGIDEVIRRNQAQFDRWRAEN